MPFDKQVFSEGLEALGFVYKSTILHSTGLPSTVILMTFWARDGIFRGLNSAGDLCLSFHRQLSIVYDVVDQYVTLSMIIMV